MGPAEQGPAYVPFLRRVVESNSHFLDANAKLLASPPDDYVFSSSPSEQATDARSVDVFTGLFGASGKPAARRRKLPNVVWLAGKGVNGGAVC